MVNNRFTGITMSLLQTLLIVAFSLAVVGASAMLFRHERKPPIVQVEVHIDPNKEQMFEFNRDYDDLLRALPDVIYKLPPKEKRQLTCLAINIYHESRGEKFLTAQYATAYVVMNRVRSRKFPDTPCEVVFQPLQFSWVEDGLTAIPHDAGLWLLSQKLAYIAYFDILPDPTKGATYYYNPDLADPKWGNKMRNVTKLGHHKFGRI